MEPTGVEEGIYHENNIQAEFKQHRRESVRTPGLWEHSGAKTIRSALIQPWAELRAEAAAMQAPHSKSHLPIQDIC